MTYKEIIAAIQGNQRRVKSELKIHATLTYKLGNLIGVAVNDPSKYPKITEAFPGMFDEPKRQQNWQLMKARIEAYAAERRKRGEKNVGDDN